MAAAPVNDASDGIVVQVPGDKSITHRALLLGSLADGDTQVRAPLDAADTRSTAQALRTLGVAIDTATGDGALGESLLVHGRGLDGWRAPSGPIDCGNSGTTARLLLGALAGRFTAELHGDASLQARPMARVTTPLATMGARFDELGEPGRLPLRVRGGPLTLLDHSSPQSSAQVKSAILVAGLVGDARVRVTESRLSRDHTERMLQAMGVPLVQSADADGHHVALDGRCTLQPLDVAVPGDFSSAAFFIACALLSPRGAVLMPGVGVNPGRVGLLAAVRRMNAVVSVENAELSAGEPIADLRVSAADLAAVEITADEVPSLIDEIPVLAILAACARGESVISGAGELRVKETDRIHAIVRNLRAVGVQTEERPDGMVITGGRGPLAGRVTTFGDHRIAMAFGVLGSLPGNHIEIDEPDAVDVSFPRFWEELARVQAAGGA